MYKRTYGCPSFAEVKRLWTEFSSMLTNPTDVLVQVFSHRITEDYQTYKHMVDLLNQSHPPHRQISYMQEVD
jgi:hypothetical protein